MNFFTLKKKKNIFKKKKVEIPKKKKVSEKRKETQNKKKKMKKTKKRKLVEKLNENRRKDLSFDKCRKELDEIKSDVDEMLKLRAESKKITFILICIYARNQRTKKM